MIGTIVVAGLTSWVAYKIAKRQTDKQSELQNKQLEEQFKRDIERDKIIIRDNLKLDTYLKISKEMMVYMDKTTEYYSEEIENIEIENNLYSNTEKDYNSGEKISSSINIINSLSKSNKEITEILNEVNILLLFIGEDNTLGKFYEIEETYNEIAKMFSLKNKNKKDEFINYIKRDNYRNEKKEYYDDLHKDYLKNDLQTIDNHYKKHLTLVVKFIVNTKEMVGKIIE